jgi:hypothetical protein
VYCSVCSIFRQCMCFPLSMLFLVSTPPPTPLLTTSLPTLLFSLLLLLFATATTFLSWCWPRSLPFSSTPPCPSSSSSASRRALLILLLFVVLLLLCDCCCCLISLNHSVSVEVAFPCPEGLVGSALGEQSTSFFCFVHKILTVLFRDRDELDWICHALLGELSFLCLFLFHSV